MGWLRSNDSANPNPSRNGNQYPNNQYSNIQPIRNQFSIDRSASTGSPSTESNSRNGEEAINSLRLVPFDHRRRSPSPVRPLGLLCSTCGEPVSKRCLDCNRLLCEGCVDWHPHHSIVPLQFVTAIGPSSSNYNGLQHHDMAQCPKHNEQMRYVCRDCSEIVCQECTFREHKDHYHTGIAIYAENSKVKIREILSLLNNNKEKIKYFIDRVASYERTVDTDFSNVRQNILTSMLIFCKNVEQRNENLSKSVDFLQTQRKTTLSHAKCILSAYLSDLATTCSSASKFADAGRVNNEYEVAKALIEGYTLINSIEIMIKSLNIEDVVLCFTPDNDVIHDDRLIGRLAYRKKVRSPPNIQLQSGNVLMRRPTTRSRQSPVYESNRAAINWHPGPSNAAGSTHLVKIKAAESVSMTFGLEGQDDGKISRPWALCTNQEGSIIVADRRNHRIQVFLSDGTLYFKFGEKGRGDGQFELPTGITTDIQNRIIVVDKDNHRVQIFAADGRFLLKFGGPGHDASQFHYPWDVAVNSMSQILVSDSRNHRIQLFTPEGDFIKLFSFEVPNNGQVKGLTGPRGICFTPHGYVLISDFDNHRLLLVDGGLTEVLTTKGHEGSGPYNFNRPSGILCDENGRIVVADSKNKRILIFSPTFELLSKVDTSDGDHDKDRPTYVALLPDGRLVVSIEVCSDARYVPACGKTYIRIY